jgi:TonB family protein
MKLRLPASLIATLALGLAPALSAADAAHPATKPGYLVVTEITFNEEGAPVETKVVKSDDPTGDHILEQLAVKMSEKDHQPPHLKDGKPVSFKARRPFNFPVEGDQGAAANTNKPVLHGSQQVLPVYPEDLAEKNEIGGAIVELTILADGAVKAVRTLRASHPEFAAAAEAALKQWTFTPDTSPGAPAEARWNVAVGFSTNGQILPLDWRLAPRPAIGSFMIGRVPKLPAAPVEPKPDRPEPGK